MVVLRRFLKQHAYLTPAIARRGELEDLIANGITPTDLRQLLQGRLDGLSGAPIGHRRVGRKWHLVRLPGWLRLRHLITVGRTGTGKTTAVRHQVIGDCRDGAGVGVIALERELIDTEILPFIPKERWDDVMLIDPGDYECPVSFNPLTLGTGEDLDLKASQLHVTLKRLCAEEGSVSAPRLELILSHSIYTLLSIPGSTLADLERLVDRGDPSFRQWAVRQLSDERTRFFWESTYESYSRDAHLSLLNRLGRLLRPKAVRNLICQRSGSFNLRQAMDAGKIVLVCLNDGLLGEDTASLLAQLFAAQFQLCAMSRADSQPEQRRPFYLYLDEAQRTAGVAESSFEQMFARCRKFGLGLTLAFQHLGQLPESLVRDALGTAGSIMSFAVGATDARRLSHELVGEVEGRLMGVDPTQLVSLPVGHAICRFGRSLFRLHALPPPNGGNERAREEILRRSRQRYGVVPSGEPDLPSQLPTIQFDAGDPL